MMSGDEEIDEEEFMKSFKDDDVIFGFEGKSE